MNIELERNETKGRYYVNFPESGGSAELTFSIANAHLIVVDHTDVPAELKGQGVGQALFFRLVEDARAEGVKIVPLCPFVKAQFGKFPETRDVT
ncbi:GNAT family N-acetyltransferase [Aliiroseovarius sp. 2305UL8-7]|uniref:GNAT family N-acetyltransferase n=1 Tax=Aliiroseovarius conchicola TaxID=3121637 RepID=UPI003529B6EE